MKDNKDLWMDKLVMTAQCTSELSKMVQYVDLTYVHRT